MIKAVLFDFGGVLSTGGKSARTNIKNFLAEHLGIDQAGVRLDDLHDNLRRGLISAEDFLSELHRRHPFEETLTMDDLLNDPDFLVKAEPVYELVDRLRNKGIKTGILSNIYEITARQLKKDGYYDSFDPVILSFEEHSSKPDLKMYEVAVSRLGVEPEEILFIDDQEINLPAAIDLGIHTIKADSPEQIVRDVQAFVEEVNSIKL